MANLAAKLGRLSQAFDSKGHKAPDSLLPGLAGDALDAQLGWFPSTLPQELRELYAWRAGQASDPWDAEFPFWFRDRGFSSIEIAKDEYSSMMESYGVENDPTRDLVNLSDCFPFAAFNGAWYVVPCKGHGFDISVPYPVISVFQDISPHFDSINAMLDTCIAWVEHPDWKSDSGLDREQERRIWSRFNAVASTC
ncbi:MAG: hypothetical protein AAF184_11775 [Pseudomonadota bacterium]